MINNKKLGWWVAKKLVEDEKEEIRRKTKEERKQAKKQNKEFMNDTFGKTRRVMAFLFGEWCLYEFNSDFYENPTKKVFTGEPTEYYILKETAANKKALKLQEDYEKVKVEKVYNEHDVILGYVVRCYGKLDRSNVVNLKNYRKSLIGE